MERLQESLGEDVHPAGENNQLGLFRYHLLGQRSIVFFTSLGDFLLILFCLGQEPMTD